MIVYIENQTNEYFNFRGYKKLITKAVDTVARQKQIPSGLEVNVMIVEPEIIRGINNETRGIDRVTDVLSFPYFDFEEPGDMSALSELVFSDEEQGFASGEGARAGLSDPEYDFDEDAGMETILGDIVICADKVVAQAEEFGHSQKRELAYLVVHSMLHLIGYDHMTPEEEKQMTTQADAMMEVLGINR